MIKAVVMDVDGVIVGKKTGFNFPLPHKDVIEKLKTIHKSGIPIVLCTAKFSHSIKEIAIQAHLNNAHITDGGALIIDPVDNQIIKSHSLDKNTARKYLQEVLAKNIYAEIYTPTSYFVEKNQISDFTTKRTHVLQMDPSIVKSIESILEKEDVIKITVFTRNDNEKEYIDNIINHFSDKINFVWSSHPYTDPAKICIVTAPNVSKVKAVEDTAKNLGVTFDEILGIGDTKGDWNFMSLCKYVGTVANANEEMKELVKSKGEGNYYIAPSVDENGIILLLDYFLQK